MKALRDMSNVEKGRLLAELFPNDISVILNAIETRHYELVENKDSYTKAWDKKYITVEAWYALAHEVFSTIIRYRKHLTKSKHFAEQLFGGDKALFTMDCIVRYANNERSGTDFYHIVTALFDTEWTVIE